MCTPDSGLSMWFRRRALAGPGVDPGEVQPTARRTDLLRVLRQDVVDRGAEARTAQADHEHRASWSPDPTDR